MTWLVNSAAHIFGTKPYDRYYFFKLLSFYVKTINTHSRNIGPVENVIVSHLTCGEGFHNYHHVFPWDYKAAELGNYTFNFTLFIINCFAKIGWAYELKTVSEKLIRQRVQRTGDGNWKQNQAELIWGWQDKNLPSDHKSLADIYK